jgi:CheY-like chemotaxis protein
MTAVESAPVARSPGTVIVYIEDNPDHVSLFKTIVAKYSSLTVLPAFTAEDGKRLLARKNGRVKCIVMDIHLEQGECEGLELLEWLRMNYANTPILVLTGHSELVPELQKKYPGVEVHIKASESVENLVRSIEAVALGV